MARPVDLKSGIAWARTSGTRGNLRYSAGREDFARGRRKVMHHQEDNQSVTSDEPLVVPADLNPARGQRIPPQTIPPSVVVWFP